MSDFRQEFIAFAVEHGVIRFGEFRTKAGRMSPYFFNAGLFNDGLSMSTVSSYYAQAVKASGVSFDMLFGPAYKGISLATGTAIALVEKYDRNVPFAYNRKEAKDHGEGGNVIGAPLKGKVLIIDDVVSAGTSVRESIDLIRVNAAEPAGVVIALDRMEYGRSSELSAVQEVEREFGIPVISVASLNDLVRFLDAGTQYRANLAAVVSYRQQYGVD